MTQQEIEELAGHRKVSAWVIKLVADAIAVEREACAKVCENMTLEWKDQPSIAQAELATMMDCALAIRARGNK